MIKPMMKTIIVDDEILARKRISGILSTVEGITVIAECNNGTSAIEEINALKPDLVFLDINVRDMDGFEVLENITCQPRPFIVFITAHDDFAVKAFDYEAFDYLVKPFKEERFLKTVEKILNSKTTTTDADFSADLKQLLQKLHPAQDTFPQKFAIKQGNKTQLVTTEKINYIISSGVYVEIFTDEQKYLYRESMNNLEQQLDPNKFLRVHRSAIVNLNAVKEIVHSDYAEIDAKMKDNTLISISKAQKKEFLTKLGL